MGEVGLIAWLAPLLAMVIVLSVMPITIAQFAQQDIQEPSAMIACRVTILVVIIACVVLTLQLAATSVVILLTVPVALLISTFPHHAHLV
jgi:hypothetical protein